MERSWDERFKKIGEVVESKAYRAVFWRVLGSTVF